MNRLIVTFAAVGLVIGLLVGYLWWGLSTQRFQTQLGEARTRTDALERQLEEAHVRARSVQDELKALQVRIKALDDDLRLERDRRSKLEMILSKGRK